MQKNVIFKKPYDYTPVRMQHVDYDFYEKQEHDENKQKDGIAAKPAVFVIIFNRQRHRLRSGRRIYGYCSPLIRPRMSRSP